MGGKIDIQSIEAYVTGIKHTFYIVTALWGFIQLLFGIFIRYLSGRLKKIDQSCDDIHNHNKDIAVINQRLSDFEDDIEHLTDIEHRLTIIETEHKRRKH